MIDLELLVKQGLLILLLMSEVVGIITLLYLAIYALSSACKSIKIKITKDQL